MKKARLLAVLIVAAFVLVTTAHAQETSKKVTQPTPAPGVSEAVLQQWNEIGRKLIAMAEDFPEAKHDFKPKPGARSFAERLIHAAAANYFFTNLVVGQKLSSEEEPKRDQFKNRAELVAYVKKSFADGPGESEKSVLVPRFFLRFALLDVP